MIQTLRNANAIYIRTNKNKTEDKMTDNEIIDQLAIRLYPKLKDQRKVTTCLVQRHAQVNGEMAFRICQRIWRMLHLDAQEMAKEVVLR